MYRYIAKIALRVALIAPILAYAVTAWGLHQRYLDSYVDWASKNRVALRVYECLAKVPEAQLRAAENAVGNFDARKFSCIFRDEPYWTNVKEVRGGVYLEQPKYWTEYNYQLELIPMVAVLVLLGGALCAALIWLIRWTFGLSSSTLTAPELNGWIAAVATGVLSAVIAGVILSKML